MSAFRNATQCLHFSLIAEVPFQVNLAAARQSPWPNDVKLFEQISMTMQVALSSRQFGFHRALQNLSYT